MMPDLAMGNRNADHSNFGTSDRQGDERDDGNHEPGDAGSFGAGGADCSARLSGRWHTFLVDGDVCDFPDGGDRADFFSGIRLPHDVPVDRDL